MREGGGGGFCMKEGGGSDFCVTVESGEGGGVQCGETNPIEGLEFWFLIARQDLKCENEK
jgi:hypothetical protein